jgi:hypothetical protein
MNTAQNFDSYTLLDYFAANEVVFNYVHSSVIKQ